MLSKINIFSIIKDHNCTLRNERSDTISLSDIATFYILPMALGSFFVFIKIQLTEGIINIIIASLSIFVGLLLNLLVLMMGILDKYKEKINNLSELEDEEGIKNVTNYKTKQRLERKQKLLNQTYYNISFAMLLAIVCIPIMVTALIKYTIVNKIANGLGYTLLWMFLFTLLMVLKRVHIILKNND